MRRHELWTDPGARAGSGWLTVAPLFTRMDNETPVRIASIRVDGATHTRRSFLNRLIQPHLDPQSSVQSTTLGSIIHTTGRISELLRDTDIFHFVHPQLERSQGPLALDGDIDVIFKTREKGRLYLNTSTEVGNGEGNAVSPACCALQAIAFMHSSL